MPADGVPAVASGRRPDKDDGRSTTAGGDKTESDAVEQAKSWLAQRGISVPDDDRVPRSVSARRARSGQPESDVPTPMAGPDHDDIRATSEAGLAGAGPLGDAARLADQRSVRRSSLFSDDDADPETVARTIVLRKLSVHARTRAELEKALRAKDVPTEAATVVLDRMEELGLVDDPTFARDWVESRQQRRYLSKVALRRELTAKGVDRTEIESALEEVQSDDELSAARALAAKKVRSMGDLEPHVRHRRLAGMLARRGFNGSVVSRVLDETLNGREP